MKNNQHPASAFLYASSKLLERAAYYGLRTTLVFYLLGEVINMEKEEAFNLLGVISASLAFSMLVGAVVGDLLLGNKRAIIIGGVLQALGAFLLCIPNTTGLYTGIGLVVLGIGLHSPNILASFGKTYTNKTKLLDAGFMLVYFAINIGAFLGILALGLLQEKLGWNIAFIVAGLLQLAAIIPILFTKETQEQETTTEQASLVKKVVHIVLAIVTASIFWILYEIFSYRDINIRVVLMEMEAITIPHSSWINYTSILTLSLAGVAIIAWTYWYSSQIVKLLLGFIFLIAAFGVLLFIPEFPKEESLIPYLTSIVCLALAEVHIGPIVYSVIAQYANPKYMAILMAITFLPSRAYSMSLAAFDEVLHENPMTGAVVGLTMSFLVILGLIIVLVVNKATQPKR